MIYPIQNFTKIIKIVRTEYFTRTTIGRLYLHGKKDYFCYVLEDTVRPFGIKVPGETAIPDTGALAAYKIDVNMSSRFKRDMPMIYTESNGYELKNGGISFKGTRLHGGNTHENTEGCPLVAYNRPTLETIQGTAEKELTAKIKEYLKEGSVGLSIINMSNVNQTKF